MNDLIGLHYCVPADPVARYEAAQQLIRPWEVEHIVAKVPSDRMTGFVAAILGRLKYIPDPCNCDRWSSPLETFARGGGDCDDSAIVGVSMLLAGGVDSYFVVGNFFGTNGWGGHAWVEGQDLWSPFILDQGNLIRCTSRPWRYQATLLIQPDSFEIAA